MSEKSSFSDLVHVSPVQPDQRACFNCFHGYPFKDLNLQTRVMCKAMPPSAIGLPTRDKLTGAIGVQVEARFPNLLPDEWCGLFEKRPPPDDPP